MTRVVNDPTDGVSTHEPPSEPREVTRSAPWLAAGLLLATSWFLYVCSVGLPNRVRGDAVAYLRVVTDAHSLADLLGHAGERTLGFPLLLYLVRVPFELVATLEPATLAAFVDTVAVVLLTIHAAACVLFFHRVRAIIRSTLGLTLHPVALTLLVAFPALVAYTTVPLTDTLAADLLMTGTALLARPARRPRARVGSALAAGAALGALVLVRPSALVVTAVLVSAALAQALGTDRRRVGPVAIAAALWAALVGWQVLNCARTYAAPCLTAPDATRRGLEESIAWGTTSARHYWSRHADDAAGRVTVPDPLLAEVVAPACAARAPLGPSGLLACLLERPIVFPLLFLKKSVGLFDAYQLHPYAVDVTPAWARRLSRPFGALAFAGFAAVGGWLLVTACSAPAGALTLLWLAPVVHVAWHALFHVEGRYGLPAVPFSLVAFVATVQSARRWRAVPRIATIVALVLAGAAFLAQTERWDRADPTLRRIEESLARGAQ